MVILNAKFITDFMKRQTVVVSLVLILLAVYSTAITAAFFVTSQRLSELIQSLNAQLDAKIKETSSQNSNANSEYPKFTESSETNSDGTKNYEFAYRYNAAVADTGVPAEYVVVVGNFKSKLSGLKMHDFKVQGMDFGGIAFGNANFRLSIVSPRALTETTYSSPLTKLEKT